MMRVLRASTLSLALVGLFAVIAMAGNLLPDGPGKILIEANCQSCHSLKLVVQQSMSRERWDEALTWMQKHHKLRQFAPEERKRILDYLAANLGPSAPAGAIGLMPPRPNVLHPRPQTQR
ncbi:MAG: hypothetical protein ETSY1_09050 [Candidatus Entotheonella factor]|uniref:Quinohemoprotein amine dehydrogenase alpha subunit haem binding domain-containing protein n=1 Tax=Entotheonella factor TaxID=1429438 RepID=W4LT28_ENTF1|nr:hypothetical protein [Candidatus Entotheonella palauensis]ETX01020.1 MAG: hypothetical protein ETSY1_09050 [Candidatus Entotheonella factor]